MCSPFSWIQAFSINLCVCVKFTVLLLCVIGLCITYAIELKERRAQFKIITKVQQQTFSREIKCLKERASVPNSSNLLQLNPFFDTAHGVLRVEDWLHNASISNDKKFPIVLPGDHIFTKLLIESVHKENLHPGMQTILCLVRQSFWVLRARRTVLSVLRKCHFLQGATPRKPA